MIKLLAIAALVLAVATAAGKAPGLSTGADAVRTGVENILPSSVKGQGDEQDGDSENSSESNSGDEP